MLYIGTVIPITPCPLENEGLFQFKKNPQPEKCCVKLCREDSGGRKKKVGDHWFCHKHWQVRYRWKNPKNSAYRALRDSAKQRGLEFRLSYDYYLGMMDCAAVWDKGAEKRGDIVSLDRIDPVEGYIPGNIQLISLSENVAKGNRERYLPEVVQSMIARKRVRASERQGGVGGELDDCPF